MGDMERKNTLIIFALSSILVLAGFAANEKAHAQTSPPPFGDFTCWISVEPGNTAQIPFGIEDQFGFITNDFWEQIEYCAATTKFLNGDFFPSPFEPSFNQHYQGWLYPLDTTGAGTGQTIILDVPQFDQTFTTTLGFVEQILVPAHKITSQGIEESLDLQQHWNCYNIQGPAPTTPGFVELASQHGDIDDILVEEPFLLCAPMIKTDPSGQPFGELLDEHMVCYDILAGFDHTTDHPTELIDQVAGSIPFNIDFASVEHPLGLEKLCAPAFKSFPSVGGSDVSINTSALLLAGAASTSMWMIPVVVSGVGIGIFVIKRRN